MPCMDAVRSHIIASSQPAKGPYQETDFHATVNLCVHMSRGHELKASTQDFDKALRDRENARIVTGSLQHVRSQAHARNDG